jgi:hypothetical protein
VRILTRSFVGNDGVVRREPVAWDTLAAATVTKSMILSPNEVEGDVSYCWRAKLSNVRKGAEKPPPEEASMNEIACILAKSEPPEIRTQVNIAGISSDPRRESRCP